jgi:hypothetical protein
MIGSRFDGRAPRTLTCFAATLLFVACMHAPRTRRDLTPATVSSPAVTCEQCSPDAMSPEVTRAIEQRIADLASRGRSCAVYGDVLERSYRERRISIRPYMWRVGPHLVSGEAHANGEMQLAREIDSLNVGVRTLADLMRTMEHEAVHIAFNISSRDESNEARVNSVMQECRAFETDDVTARRDEWSFATAATSRPSTANAAARGTLR